MLEMIQQAYGSESLLQAQIFSCHKMPNEGLYIVEEESRSDLPSTSGTKDIEQRLRHLLNSDRRLSVRMIEEELELDEMVVDKIICEDLGMRKICAKLVAKVFTDEQKQNRETLSRDLLGRIEKYLQFLDNVITGAESWFFDYGPETKRQSNEWHTPKSPRQKKAHMSKSRMKSLLIVFFDNKGIVHSEFVSKLQTVLVLLLLISDGLTESDQVHKSVDE